MQLFIRLVVLFAVVFAIVYGLIRVLRKPRQDRQLAARLEAQARLDALGHALDKGELDRKEYDQLTRQIYSDCRDKGVELEEL